MSGLQVEYERLKREATGKQEQDRGTINNLNSEIRNFRAQFDETVYVKLLS